ncbi:hypothetical protein QFC21_004677 [Naganishia friedmannii]|uniref:Uncharacterized protein n=1 Tax=Naganishia friedmannii TaxID=89922 RepID=A0ACC2VEZ0_9TREE|nr:hypothetical protein QFC21_004677 [Naganishia friedmannii]
MSSGGFKVPALPVGAPLKRKLPDESNGSSSTKRSRPTVEDDTASSSASVDSGPSVAPSDSSNKPAKRSYNFGPSIPIKSANRGGSVTTDVKGKSREMEVDDAMDVGGDDADETFEADEGDVEGRFFGGGTNQTQEQILDMFARVEDDMGSGLPTVPELRRQIIKFERIVQKNTEMRARFIDDPSKYLDSEAELDKAFTFLYPLTADPLTYYPELSRHETLIATLTNLLTHENTDIALQVVAVIFELTDEDVGEELVEGAVEEEEEDDDEKREEVARKVRMVMGEFVTALLDNSLFELLVPNLTRLNEQDEESDRTGVFNILGIFENILSFIPPLALQVVNTTELLPWLLKRIARDRAYDSNKQYATEILAILLQEEREVRLKFVEFKGVDITLEAEYRQKDPADSEEVEYMENLFNTLCSALAEPEAKRAFNDAEGVELMVLIMKDKKAAKTRAIKVLDYACQTDTDEGKKCGERFVEALGLKTLFPVFMGKTGHKKSKRAPTATHSALEDEEHVLSILSSLFTTLESDSVPRIRLLAKFVEADYEKVDRLIEMMEGAEGRLRSVHQEIELEEQGMKANNEEITEVETDEWYMRRMNAGLAHLQDICYCLAWLIMEDDGAQAHARMLLDRKGRSFEEISAVLKEMRDVIAADVDMPEDDSEGAKPNMDDPAVQKTLILDALTQFLDGI